MASPPKKAVLFVCLGNICRSPIAEAVFNHVLHERGTVDQWIVDSAATENYHTGISPDKRAQQTMKKHNIQMNHKARQICEEDFNMFDYVFGMDDSNISDLNEIAPRNCKAKVELLGSYDPEGQLIIEDPYYDHDTAGFEKVYKQCLRCCNAFLDKDR